MNIRDISSGELAELIIRGMQEKKGVEIVRMDLRKISKSLVDYFVVCHATSNTHAEAITDSVEKIVKTTTGLNPSHIEGTELREWVLIDYFDVVVHIFLEPVRKFYRLEELWADADITKIEEQ